MWRKILRKIEEEPKFIIYNFALYLHYQCLSNSNYFETSMMPKYDAGTKYVHTSNCSVQR